MAGSWADFDPGYPPTSGGSNETDVITTTSEAPRTRTVAELSARIKQAGGAIVVSPNDSLYIVAVNNGLRFSVTRLANGQYRITESSNFLILIGVAVVAGIVLLSRR